MRPVAQLMLHIGLVLLTLAILLRLAFAANGSTAGSDLAIGASLLVTLSAVTYLRLGR